MILSFASPSLYMLPTSRRASVPLIEMLLVKKIVLLALQECLIGLMSNVQAHCGMFFGFCLFSP